MDSEAIQLAKQQIINDAREDAKETEYCFGESDSYPGDDAIIAEHEFREVETSSGEIVVVVKSTLAHFQFETYTFLPSENRFLDETEEEEFWGGPEKRAELLKLFTIK